MFFLDFPAADSITAACWFSIVNQLHRLLQVHFLSRSISTRLLGVEHNSRFEHKSLGDSERRPMVTIVPINQIKMVVTTFHRPKSTESFDLLAICPSFDHVKEDSRQVCF